MKAFMICIFCILAWLSGQAQDPLIPKEDRSRFRFAQTYMGLSTQYLPGASLLQPDGGSSAFPAMMHPRFLIGGTHFWGLTDFFISIPLSSPLPLGESPDGLEADFNTGVMTGAKFYPLRMRSTALDPYLGASWSFFNVQVDGAEAQGPELTHHRLALEAGLSYTSRNWHIFELFATYTPNTSVDYYTSRTQVGRFEWPGWSAGVSYKKMFDSTEGSEPVQDLGAKRHLNAWHIGIGPSTAQALKASDFVAAAAPFLNNPMSWDVFPELSLGYYWHRPDLDFRLTFRPMQAEQEAYGLSHKVNRQSLALEGYANLLDYQGFVPFVGLSLAAERYRFRQQGSEAAAIDHTDSGIFPGLVFGWDIRPTRYKSWLLRTNLRFYPTAGFEVEGQAFSMNKLEFNFIQLVLFPQRMFE